ncbi:hypothetical protein, partial [Levilactobacillus fuyuanensis]
GSKSGKCNLALTHKSQRLETLASNPGLIALEKTTRSTGGFYFATRKLMGIRLRQSGILPLWGPPTAEERASGSV